MNEIREHYQFGDQVVYHAYGWFDTDYTTGKTEFGCTVLKYLGGDRYELLDNRDQEKFTVVNEDVEVQKCRLKGTGGTIVWLTKKGEEE